MKTLLKNYRQQPQKVRLIADLVRGKRIEEALSILAFSEKRAAEPFAKAIRSAVANAVQSGKKEENLFIKQVAVNKGITYKRFMPRARGTASRINKRTSHISIELGEKNA